MNTKEIFTYVTAKYFFPEFAPDVTNWKNKIRGVNTHGKEIDFTEEDKLQIRSGLLTMSAKFVIQKNGK